LFKISFSSSIAIAQLLVQTLGISRACRTARPSLLPLQQPRAPKLVVAPPSRAHLARRVHPRLLSMIFHPRFSSTVSSLDDFIPTPTSSLDVGDFEAIQGWPWFPILPWTPILPWPLHPPILCHGHYTPLFYSAMATRVAAATLK
jgi:hypothetical protein